LIRQNAVSVLHILKCLELSILLDDQEIPVELKNSMLRTDSTPAAVDTIDFSRKLSQRASRLLNTPHGQIARIS
jgi:hypothetical protein